MKRLYSFLLVTIAFMLLFESKVIAQSVTIDGIRYTIENGVASASAADKSIVSAKILSTAEINGSEYPVRIIAERAFNECAGLTSVTLPEGITTIGNSAFLSCTLLTQVAIPESVTTIGTSAFSGCSSLSSVTLPEGLITIESLAFSGCSSLASMTLPNSLTTLGRMTFAGCSSLASVIIPEGITTIEYGLLAGCPALTSVTIHDNVTSIGKYAFYNCASLASVTLPEGITSIGEEAFYGCSSIQLFTLYCDISSISADEIFGDSEIGPGSTLYVYSKYLDHFSDWESIFSEVKILSAKVTYMVDGEVYATQAFASGDTLVLIDAPIKEGHVFSGWCEVPVTMPLEDIVITGTFSPDVYKVTYMVKGEVYHTDSVTFGAVIIAPEPPVDPENDSQVFTGWIGLPETMPAHDITVIGDGYRLTYIVDGVTYKDSIYSYGSVIIPIAEPVKEGHTFSGWSKIPTTMPTNDIVVKGSFAINTYKVTYMVDNKEHHTDSVVYSASVNPLAEPVKEGYTFSGWSEIPATMPANDIVVKGNFNVNTYKITYVVDNEECHTDSIAYSAYINPIAEPVKEGYTFSGWSKVPTTMPANDIVVTGTFAINIYKLTYMVDGKVYHVDSIAYANDVTPIEEPVKDGSTFNGWSEIPATMPANDVTVMGTFATMTYKVTYLIDGEEYRTDSVVYAAIIPPAPNPTKEGHTFSGWSEIPATMPAENITITGSFAINTYKITYIIDGEVYHTDSIVYADPIIPVEKPVKEGYTLNGWNEIPETMPAHDVTISCTFIIADKNTDEQGLVFDLNETRDAFEVSGYTDDLIPDVVIPTEYYGLPVTAIQPRALAFTLNLQSLVVPSSIKSVGKNSLGGNETLLTIEWNTTAPLDAACFSPPSNYGNMLVYVADAATEITFQGNVVVEGVIEQLTLIDELPFRNIHEFTARHITFTRNFDKKNTLGVSSGWEAMVLPFDVQSVVSKNKGELKPFGEADFITSLPYWLGSLQADGTFTATQRITANNPVIIQLPNSDEYEDRYNVEGEVTFSATDATVHTTLGVEQPEGEGYSLLGSYEGTAANSHVYALNDEEYTADGDVHMLGGIFVANSRDIRPFEAYIYNGNATRAPHLIISREGETGIKQSTANSQQPTVVYDLMGRKILNNDDLRNGIYIMNGKKIVKK